jgi:hypothetical protein
VGDTAGVTQDVGSDPTVGLPTFCTSCGEEIDCPISGKLSDWAFDNSDDYVGFNLEEGEMEYFLGAEWLFFAMFETLFRILHMQGPSLLSKL